MNTKCKRLYIFEGPDGSGKTTAAEEFASRIGAKLIHFGPMLDVKAKFYPRILVEAMLPALLGYQDVVFDRCWISEPIYGRVFRGDDRLGVVGRRTLERIALKCGATVVLCCPPKHNVLSNWRKRKGAEYVNDESAMSEIIDRYSRNDITNLPMFYYDYTLGSSLQETDYEELSTKYYVHDIGLPMSGNIKAKNIILDYYKDQPLTDENPFFNVNTCADLGYSRGYKFFTEHLGKCGVSERDLLWVNTGAYNLYEALKFIEQMGQPLSTMNIYAIHDSAISAVRMVNSTFLQRPVMYDFSVITSNLSNPQVRKNVIAKIGK